ncbi:MAG: hypothetical protein PVJ80_14480 [Gemmatimonadota bacterium]
MQRRPERPSTPTMRQPKPVCRARVTAGFVAMFLAIARPVAAQLPAPPVVGDGPFQWGGYASITMGQLDRPEAVEGFEVSELSAALLGWGQLSTRTSYFVELDMAKRTSETWTGRETDQWIVPERLYLEYTADRALRVRLGRFLTPIGQWNEQHAEPLTWTPTRPLTTYSPFAKSLTGFLVAGDGTIGGRDVGYAAFWAPSVDLDGDLESEEESEFASALGARFATTVHRGLTLGGSIARIRRTHPDETDANTGSGPRDRIEEEGGRPLLGTDLRWTTSRFELTAEATWLLASDDQPYEGGVFGLASIRLWGPLWGVVRAEAYHPMDDLSIRTGFAGLTLRADRRFIAKVGRQFSRHPSIRIPDGWFASFSSLF